MSADEAPETQPASFMTAEDEDEGNATATQKPPGEALAGSPGENNDDCTLHYREQRHELYGAEYGETSPSAGWRRVYAEMGVYVDAER